jgi:PPOX class probable F420-dependent enzyme
MSSREGVRGCQHGSDHRQIPERDELKRDGTPVSTPVWFVADNGHLLVETEADSGKAKRIRANPSVTVSPCSASGKPKADPIPAHAAFLAETERPRIEALIESKYRVDKVLVLPIYRTVKRLLGKPSLAHTKPVILEITPD